MVFPQSEWAVFAAWVVLSLVEMTAEPLKLQYSLLPMQVSPIFPTISDVD